MPARRAITRVSLLVVILIAVLMVGLGLPAISQIRAIAARAGCHNNLRRLSLAALNYWDSDGGVIPPGTMPDTALPPDQRLSLYLVLLPYIESQPVYNRLVRSEPWDSERNVAALADWPPRLDCPQSEDRSKWAYGHLVSTNTVGLAGLGADAAILPADDPRVGMFGYDRRLKVSQVKDGLANTALFVETARDPGPWARGGPSTVRGIDPADRPLTGEGRPFGGLHRPGRSFPWQRAWAGTTVGLADGSVRYLRDDADPAILTALVTVAGGEPVPADW